MEIKPAYKKTEEKKSQKQKKIISGFFVFIIFSSLEKISHYFFVFAGDVCCKNDGKLFDNEAERLNEFELFEKTKYKKVWEKYQISVFILFYDCSFSCKIKK